MGGVARGKVAVTLSLPRALDRALELEVARLDVSKSEYVAAAVARMLGETKRLPPEQARELVVSVTATRRPEQG